MTWYRDGQGRLWDYADPEEAQRDNLVPAAPEDIEAHNHAAKVEKAGEGTTIQSGLEQAQRAIGGIAEGIQKTTGFGTAPGLDEADDGSKLPGGGLFPEAYTPEARLRREAHPIAAGIGGALVAAPFGAVAGALAPAVGPSLLGGAVSTVAAEAVPAAVEQEYTDAWLESRPMELTNVAVNTLMFAGTDYLFRGVGKGVKSAWGKMFGAAGEEVKPTSLGGRNVVAEAEAAAGKASKSPEWSSVGAARSSDLDEPFDDAFKHMTDKDAAVLARDADDHLNLVATHAADEMTRVNNGISENLSNKLKYQDFAEYAKEWDARTLERQASAVNDLVEQGDAVARNIGASTKGSATALDYGNIGKQIVNDIDNFNRLISQETDGAKRNWMADEFKKKLDSRVMGVSGSMMQVDAVTRKELLGQLQPLVESWRGALENPKLFPGSAELQRELNAPWHQFLKDWPAVKRVMLEATGHIKYGEQGAGRVEQEATVDRMLALFSKDPRSLREFGKHLSGAFDGLQGLIEARERRGIVAKDGLESMLNDIGNLKEDWNLAATVGVAKNRAAHMARDPRKWASIVADIGEKAPVIGKGVGFVRAVGRATEPLYLKEGTPLYNVWDRGLKRYAQHPSIQDPSIVSNYSEWMQKALAKRGGQIPPGAGPGLAKTGGAMQQAEDILNRYSGQGGAVVIEGGATPRLDRMATKLKDRLATFRELESNVPSGKAAAEAHADKVDMAREKLYGQILKIRDEFSAGVADLTHGGQTAPEALRPKARAKFDRLKAGLDELDAVIEKNSTRHTDEVGDFLDTDPVASAEQYLSGRATRDTEAGAVESGPGIRGILGSPLGVASGLGGAGLFAGKAYQMADRPPPEAPPPEVAYRDAMRRIAQGGNAVVARAASDSLKLKPPKGAGAMKAFLEGSTLNDRVDQVRDALQTLSTDPSALVEQIAGNTGDLHRTHPGVYMSMVGRAHQIVGYLQQNAPKRTAPTVLDPEGMPPSFDSSLDFLFKYTGAAMPKQAMKDISTLDAPPEEVAAFQENWLELWTPFASELMGQALKMAEAGRNLPSEKLRKLDTLLGMNGQLDPSASMAVAQTMLQAQDSAAQKSGQQGGAPSGAASSLNPQGFATRLGALSAERDQ